MIIALAIVGIIMTNMYIDKKKSGTTTPEQNPPLENPEIMKEQLPSEEDLKPESVEPYLWEK